MFSLTGCVLFDNISHHVVRDHRPQLRYSLRRYIILGIRLGGHKGAPAEQVSKDDVAEQIEGQRWKTRQGGESRVNGMTFWLKEEPNCGSVGFGNHLVFRVDVYVAAAVFIVHEDAPSRYPCSTFRRSPNYPRYPVGLPAAVFAVLVYQSAWLNRPMGFWSPAVLVNDARWHGISVLNVDLNRSQGVCTLEGKAIRLGLCYVSRLGERHLKAILSARQNGLFADLADFCRRVRLPLRVTENLILSGALDGFGRSRRELLWELGSPRAETDELAFIFPVEPVSLPAFSRAERLRGEYATLGLSTGEHPMALYREKLASLGILGSRGLEASKQGQIIRVAGQVVMHQAPPTAKGHRFVTLEDEDGMMNFILRPSIYARYRDVMRESPLLVVEGEVQQHGAVVNLLARRAWRLG